jgi:translation initiation factor 2B subunit (eIF-2B alpha/beta/delta family)
MREGVTLARKLGAEGIPVKLIVDAAACWFVSQVRLVLVGADALSAQGLVNKTGTAVLALAAKNLGIDIYSLTSTAKLVPAGYQPPDQELRPPSEMLEEPPPNVTPVNYYFDLTPLEHLSGVVTEIGILPSEMLLRLLGTIRVHPALAV